MQVANQIGVHRAEGSRMNVQDRARVGLHSKPNNGVREYFTFPAERSSLCSKKIFGKSTASTCGRAHPFKAVSTGRAGPLGPP